MKCLVLYKKNYFLRTIQQYTTRLKSFCPTLFLQSHFKKVSYIIVAYSMVIFLQKWKIPPIFLYSKEIPWIHLLYYGINVHLSLFTKVKLKNKSPIFPCYVYLFIGTMIVLVYFSIVYVIQYSLLIYLFNLGFI